MSPHHNPTSSPHVWARLRAAPRMPGTGDDYGPSRETFEPHRPTTPSRPESRDAAVTPTPPRWTRRRLGELRRRGSDAVPHACRAPTWPIAPPTRRSVFEQISFEVIDRRDGEVADHPVADSVADLVDVTAIRGQGRCCTIIRLCVPTKIGRHRACSTDRPAGCVAVRSRPAPCASPRTPGPSSETPAEKAADGDPIPTPDTRRERRH